MESDGTDYLPSRSHSRDATLVEMSFFKTVIIEVTAQGKGWASAYPLRFVILRPLFRGMSYADVINQLLSYRLGLKSVFILAICVLWAISSPAQPTFTLKGPGQSEPGQAIGGIQFLGNHTYPSIVLTEQLQRKPQTFLNLLGEEINATIFDPELLPTEIHRIETFYRERGYYQVIVEAQILPESTRNVVYLLFKVFEGNPIKVSSIDVRIDAPQTDAMRISTSEEYTRTLSRLPFSVGEAFHSYRQSDAVSMFTRILREEGYPFTEVHLETVIDTIALSAQLHFQLDPGPFAILDSIEVKGARTISDSRILRQSGLTQGESFSLSTLESSRRRLLDHHLFQEVSIEIPPQPRDQTVDVRIQVKEWPLRSVGFSIGLGTEEYMRASLDWQHRNINGRGHRIEAGGRVSFIDQALGGSYLIPYVFNPRSGYSLNPFLEHHFGPSGAYEVFRTGIEQSLIYQISTYLTGRLSHEISVNRELSGQALSELPDSVLNYNVSAISASVNFVQGLARREGWLVSAFGELSTPIGLGTFEYQKASVEVRRYKTLTSDAILALRVRAGAIVNASTDTLPSTILFYQGGTNSVRGWARESLGPKRPILRTTEEGTTFDRYVPIGGKTLFNASIELRRDINDVIKGAGYTLFLDMGQVWNSLQLDEMKTLQFGLGGGIRYDTPIGPFRMDIAWKMNPTREDLDLYAGVDYGNGWNRIGIHVGIGPAF